MNRTERLSIVIGMVVLLGACNSKIMRETVLATTSTAVGLMVTQNAQTQAYEFKFGYARAELFMVPTDKAVIYKEKGNVNVPEKDVKVGAARTAEVLGEIQVGGSSRGDNGAGVKVYQRLAVGKLAVQSGAAIALLSQDSETAKAAARVSETLGSGASSSTRAGAFSVLANVNDWYLNQLDNEKLTALRRGMDGTAVILPKQYDFVSYEPTGDRAYAANDHTNLALLDSGFGSVLDYLSKLNDSIANLQSALNEAASGKSVKLNDKEVDATLAAKLGMELDRQKSLMVRRLRELNEMPGFLRGVDAYLKAVFGR